MCPSLACLDVKMYSFLNSQSCICSIGDLEHLRYLGREAVAHLRVALIGALAATRCPPILGPPIAWEASALNWRGNQAR